MADFTITSVTNYSNGTPLIDADTPIGPVRVAIARLDAIFVTSNQLVRINGVDIAFRYDMRRESIIQPFGLGTTPSGQIDHMSLYVNRDNRNGVGTTTATAAARRKVKDVVEAFAAWLWKENPLHFHEGERGHWLREAASFVCEIERLGQDLATAHANHAKALGQARLADEAGDRCIDGILIKELQ